MVTTEASLRRLDEIVGSEQDEIGASRRANWERALFLLTCIGDSKSTAFAIAEALNEAEARGREYVVDAWRKCTP